MSESEEEWITVRRRRGGRSGLPKQLKALPIPVVPLAFSALAEPDERQTQPDQNKNKKKKKSKKAKAADEQDHDFDEGPAKGPSTTAKPSTAPTGGTSKSAVQATASSTSPSLLSWLLSRLWAFLAVLGLVRAAAGGSAKKKRRAGKASTVAAKTPSADGAAAAAAVAASSAPAKAEAEGIPKTGPEAIKRATAAKPSATAAKSAAPLAAATERKASASSAAVAAPPAAAAKKDAAAPAAATTAAAAVRKVPDDAAAAAPANVKPVEAPSQVAATTGAAAASKPTPPVAAEATDVSRPAAAAASATPTTAAPPPPSTPSTPPPPSIKYDSDWGRGKFVLHSLTGAHADVVAAVALAGEVAVSAGYDGAVKVWHWPGAQSFSLATAPRPPTLSRTLVGHSGRVEALAAHGPSGRLASSGRDSTLKVWDLGSEPGGAAARELASTYVYESVRSMAADWTGGGGGGAGRVLLGARSGTVLVYDLGGGGGGRKVATLRGHEDEVTAVKFLHGTHLGVSGSREGAVRLWDLRTPGEFGGAVATLGGLSGRVASLGPLGPHHLVVGDCSTSIKIWDLRSLPSSSSRPAPRAPGPRRLPNAPGFAGDACPTAGLWNASRGGVLLSSCVAWWTENRQALEEAPPSATLPTACINVSAVGSSTTTTNSSSATASDMLVQYQYTVRLGPGVVTAMAGNGGVGGVVGANGDGEEGEEGAVLAGGATGTLWALRLVRGGSGAAGAAERAVAAAVEAEGAVGKVGLEVVDGLVVGAEEFSDDEYDEEEEEGEEDGDV